MLNPIDGIMKLSDLFLLGVVFTKALMDTAFFFGTSYSSCSVGSVCEFSSMLLLCLHLDGAESRNTQGSMFLRGKYMAVYWKKY